MAKLNLSYTIITAPYDGYMGRRTLEPGQFVQAGQTISYLVRGNDKWITANYKETQISHIYIGQKVRIKVDAFHGHIFHGTVTAISEATGSKYALVPTDNSNIMKAFRKPMKKLHIMVMSILPTWAQM